jgi:vancomycin resistance protein VanW
MTFRVTLALLAIPLLVGAALLAWLLRLPAGEQEIAAFSTGLSGRAQSQVHNVGLALAALDGQVIPPGKEFSFNTAVGPWTADRGYRKAPVSYSGELTLDWGGGVCQASTTLYNAALLAGLPITERHRHWWPAAYVPPGQDAAVAYPNIDLRFRNSLRAPLRISAQIAGQSLLIRLYSRQRPPAVSLDRRVLAVTAPSTVVRSLSPGSAPRLIPGQPGYQVVLYRVFGAQESRRELVSRDTYPPQNRVILR